MKGAMGNLMRQAQQMQEKMQKMQEEIANTEVTGEAGAGLVKVQMTGSHEVRRIHIDPSLLDDDRDMLEDLTAAAVNDAVNKVADLTREHSGNLAGGLNLPPGVKLPF